MEQTIPVMAIIEEAYERLGILPELITAQQVKSAIRSLNVMLTSWMNRGLNLWTVREQELPLFPLQVEYSLDPNTCNVLEALLRRELTIGIEEDTVMSPLSRQEWMSLPNKRQRGLPTCYYLDRLIKPKVYVWPAPIAEHKLILSTSIMMDRVERLDESIPLPSRFWEPAMAGLAFYLASKVAPYRIGELEAIYEKTLQKALEEDTEDVPLRLGVTWQEGMTW
ncbi:hypothetical protein Bealeia1_01997 (plasmid) [Candidatus Bealeia paramacronuclearis]|uniref:Uncharacterized protein n=1 Tax=Candidatus Bealeia paramacronuclearis TaxID=1921001 RepID=A0ABZ2C634_9PROT|nr:hypothetical protein [Candidatus Bealeia paramacronuclearis]